MADHRWAITAIADDGDKASIEENKDGSLRRLLTRAVRDLYGPGKDDEEYEIVIGGVIQADLDATLEQAGLHDGSEVVVQPTDVSKG
jgi:hypothetical protein